MQPKILLFLICIFFLFTRLYRISEIPPSVYWDEASIGYNAYSIAQTGKDEWGEVFPVHFRAFGEFKLPVYIYTTAIFVKFFGLNEFSVRFPAVLFGLGTVVLTYLLAKKLFGVYTGLLASFFLAISPWFFIFSRTGYEATAGLMFYLFAVYMFIMNPKNKWFLVISALSFVLSIYSYNSFRIITPLTILIFTPFIPLKKSILPLTLSVLLLFASAVPVYRLYVFDAGSVRFQAIGTSDIGLIITNYLSHFSLDFLTQGDKNLRSQQAGIGQVYFVDLLLIPFGIYFLFRSKSKYKLLPLVLALIAPIPAALTKESPHALRAIAAAPFISIISAIGVANIKFKFSVFITAIYLIFFINYFVSFLTIYPIQSAKDWQYEYKRIYTDYGKQIMGAKEVFISDKLGQPYIFALFYLKYDPEKFRETVIRNSVDQWGFSQVAEFDKFIFRKNDKLIEYE